MKEYRALLIYIHQHFDEEIHKIEQFLKSKTSLKKHFKVVMVNGEERFEELSGLYTIKESIGKSIEELREE